MAFAAPLPTVAARPRSRLWGIAVYWHFLSLDAPTVAVLWAWSFAHATQVRASITSIAVLGIGTWLLYVADRLLDVGSPRHPALRERHFFHARHRTMLLRASVAAGILLLALIGIMPAAARRDDAILFVVAMLYFTAVHLPALRVRRWFPREAAVGVVFALATAVPAWSQPGLQHEALAGLVALFAGLCTLNCIAIEIWERSGRLQRSSTVPAAAIGLAIPSAALLLLSQQRDMAAFGTCAALLASTLLLFVLDRIYRSFTRRNSGPEERAHFLLILRVAADAVLLTPLFLVFPWHP